MRVPLFKRGEVVAYTQIDACDEPALRGLNWHLHLGYASTESCRQRFYLHRSIVGLEHGDRREADHISGDRLDNRRTNLRVVTHAQNMQNSPAYRGAVSPHRGVCMDIRSGRWQAYARLNGRMRHLGLHDTELEAAHVAAEFRRQHMPFANPARDVRTPIEINERNAA